MPTYTFDDGSTITDNVDQYGGWTTSSMTATDAGVGAWGADEREAAKLGQFYQNGSMPWWEQLASYGATRAIDAHFGPPAVDKTSQPGTFAGQNGKTYTTGSAVPAGGGVSGLMLLGLAALAAVAFM